MMAWLRIDLRALRAERPWYTSIYTDVPVEPLSAAATREAQELVDVVLRLDNEGMLARWNLSHADLALTLRRLGRTDLVLPPIVQRFFDENHERPSIRAYLGHTRPPHPPP
jgi:glutathione S-transferase